MRNMRILLIISALLVSIVSFAQNDLLENARKLYDKGDFDKAITVYDSIVKQGFESSGLYYNLGCSYYKKGELAYAIYNFEKANKLNPGDPDILFNLEMSQKSLVDKLEVIPELFVFKWYNSLIKSLSSNNWAYISLTAFILFVLLIGFYSFSSTIGVRKLSFYFSILFIIVSAFTFSFSSKQKENIINSNEAIILTPSITITSTPNDAGTELFILHEGTKVKIVDSVGDWKKIEITNGDQGWLKNEDLLKF